MEDETEEEDDLTLEDLKFDQLYPARIRKISALHLTPVRVAKEAARLLVTAPGTRVLDLGCGPGKFCLVAATLSAGHFTGIEQRADLALAAREAVASLGLTKVEIIHGNLIDLAFENYESFYLYNPFEENMLRNRRIDTAVPLSPLLFKKYNQHVATQLGQKPIGTRVVTYAGYADEIPSCYDCESALFRDELKLWIKRREYDPALEQLGLHSSRSYRGPVGRVEPKRPA